MTDEQIVIEVAKLDGFTFQYGVHVDRNNSGKLCCSDQHGSTIHVPDYLTSRDAIVPVIEKWANKNMVDFSNFVCCLRHELKLDSEFELVTADIWFCLTATPRQLCIALLRATGKYKEEPAIAQ